MRSEAGFAVPAVITLIVVGLAVAAAATGATISAIHGAVRDQDSKQALAAADAGAEIALYRQNQIALDFSANQICVVEGLAGVLISVGAEADGWCQAQTGTAGDANYSYRVKPPSLVGTLGNKRRMTIVSTGTSNGVTRRIKTTAVAPTGSAVFGEAGAQGVDAVTIGGSSDVTPNPGATIGAAATNGDVTVTDSGVLCGQAGYGYGHAVVLAGSAQQCPGYTNSETYINLGVPKIPATNDNARLATPNQSGSDTVAPPGAVGGCTTFCWDDPQKPLELSLSGSTTVTLGGSTYVFCKLTMTGSSTLVIAGTASTRIYIKPPEECGNPPPYPADTTQFSMTGSSSIISTSSDPNAAAILMVGSDAASAPNVNLTGSSKLNEFVLYAPRHDVTITGSSDYLGAIAGKTLTIGGSASVQIPQSSVAFGANVLIRYQRERYVECSTTTGSTPDANC